MPEEQPTKHVDWKEFLSADDEEHLNALLHRVSKYRNAYKNADDVRRAQLWAACLDLYKHNVALQKRLAFVEDILTVIYEKYKAKDEKRLELIKSLERF